MSDPSDETIELRAEARDDYVAETRWRSRKPWLKGVIAGGALIVFGIATWYAYSVGMRAGSEGAAPLIRAEQRPTKVKPDDPGGMNVPHQDKTIFERVKPQDGDTKKVEQLLPPPEEPVARPKKKQPPQQAAAPETPPAAPPSPVPAATPSPAPAATPTPAPTPEAKAPAADAKLPPTDPKAAAPPANAPQALTPAAPPATTAPAQEEKPADAQPKPATTTPTQTAVAPPAKNGAYKVQIAAVKSQEDAEREWAKLKSAHSDLLGALTLSVQRADLGAKGIYYRVQAGPLADAAAAKELCGSLQQRKIGCLVVRP